MDEMTTPELNQFLEMLARLIEANAKTVEEAAQISPRQQGQGIKSERPPRKRRSLPPNKGEPGALPRPPPL